MVSPPKLTQSFTVSSGKGEVQKNLKDTQENSFTVSNNSHDKHDGRRVIGSTVRKENLFKNIFTLNFIFTKAKY